MIGYAPVFGLSYPFGKKSQPSGELELNFQGFGWQNNSDTFPIDEGRFLNSKGIMIHMTYRILLKK
jgi:hypothetical protein